MVRVSKRGGRGLGSGGPRRFDDERVYVSVRLWVADVFYCCCGQTAANFTSFSFLFSLCTHNSCAYAVGARQGY